MSNKLNTFLLPLAALTGLVCLLTWAMIFFYAPVEKTMGVVQKIFYIHVPAAIATYAGFTITSGCSLIYLLRPNNKLDVAARAGAHVGMFFCVFVLLSGPLWGLKAWGKAWTWDPQLTATFVLFLLYGGYIMLRAFNKDTPANRRIASVLAIIAFVDIPLIHYAVRNWGGLHPVVEREGGAGLIFPIKITFSVSMLSFLLLFALMFLLLYRSYVLEQELDELHVDMADISYELEMMA